MGKQAAWLLISKGNERNYKGNEGYDDKIDSIYRYDSFVANSKQISVGDIAVIRDGKVLLGIGCLEEINATNGPKRFNSCPQCANTTIELRKTKNPPYRCPKCHFEFDEPKIKTKPATHYEAQYGTTFIPAVVPLPASRLKEALPNYNPQMAMQRLELQGLMEELDEATPGWRALLSTDNPKTETEKTSSNQTTAPKPAQPDAFDIDDVDYMTDDAGYVADDADYMAEEGEAYIPTHEDERERAAREAAVRKGQAKFRRDLLKRYGPQCQITGTNVPNVLEAAHIIKYGGEKDNNVNNGLLLRIDLHRLFDHSLLAIHPDSLTVHIHPKIGNSNYIHFQGLVLRVGKNGPSKEALAHRWKAFQTAKPSKK